MAIYDDNRKKEYKDILTKENVTTQDLIKLNDMLTEDFAKVDEIESTNLTLKTENDDLKDTNHKLFLKVTSEDNIDSENTVEKSMTETFAEMIQKGEI